MRRLALLVGVGVLALLPAAPVGALLSETTETIDTTTDALADALVGDDEPLLVEWSALLPGFTDGYDPSSSNECKAGQPGCVQALIREMERRLERYGCDHNSLFALAYLRTTEEYQRASNEPGFFADPRFLNHYDAVFARFYFDAEDGWRAGSHAEVDPAWQVAFAAADASEVTSTGNLLLGMNAHINNDLPFTLATIGLVAPDGTSRKPDHDKVNQFLNRLSEPMRAEIVARYDPAFGDGDLPGTLDDSAIMQVIVTWREAAWRNAERIVNAPTPAQRALVEAEIRVAAGLEAEAIRAAYAYAPLRSPAARDAHCAEHR
jgi:hypothetical protein